MHLKNLVLRAWWDDESAPSIETPIGDFFGLGLGEYFVYQSELLAVAPVKALNSYFQMPFATAARITLENQGPATVRSLYFAIDYVALPLSARGPGPLSRAISPGRAVQSRGERRKKSERQRQLRVSRSRGQGTFCRRNAGRAAERNRMVWRRRRHDFCRWGRDADDQWHGNGRLFQRRLGLWRPALRVSPRRVRRTS